MIYNVTNRAINHANSSVRVKCKMLSTKIRETEQRITYGIIWEADEYDGLIEFNWLIPG